MLNGLARKIGVVITRINNKVEDAKLQNFANNPKNLIIELPRRIACPERIFIGDDVWLGPGSLIIAIDSYPTPPMKHPTKEQNVQIFDPKIVIGNRVTSTANLVLAAMQEIVVEDDVMFASNINITDGFHGYRNANEPYKYQEMMGIAPIRIKKGCWIGQNVVITPGVTIGEFAIIGANSVVTSNIPDRCIASGTPARVSKKWNEEVRDWVPTENG